MLTGRVLENGLKSWFPETRACRPATFTQNPRVFHLPPYADVTTAMMNDADQEIASMGWNLFHDPRISVARFRQFKALRRKREASLGHSEPLKDALGDYWTKEVNCSKEANCQRRKPAFLKVANKNNHYAPAGQLPPLPPEARLVRVVNLSKLHKVFVRAFDGREVGFVDYGLPASAGKSGLARTAWLDAKLADFLTGRKNGLDATHVRGNGTLQALLAFLESDHRAFPYEPVWATLWSDFSDNGQCPVPEQWSQRVGVKPYDEDAWYLLLSYEARRVPTLVRPTQLDGGWYPEHFPVPTSAKVGHAMDLDLSRPSALRPEFIHRQIVHEPADLLALARLKPPTYPHELVPPQQRHYHLLVGKYQDTPATTPTVPHPAFR